MSTYLFNSNRLGFREWQEKDLIPLFKMCSDPEVMKYFPAALDMAEAKQLMIVMKNEYKKRAYCYFAVDHLHHKEFIGFIGLKWQTYPSDFNPSIDIGWRLSKKYQGLGLATEGAKRCITYGFSELGIKKIVAVAPKINEPSILVMKK